MERYNGRFDANEIALYIIASILIVAVVMIARMGGG